MKKTKLLTSQQITNTATGRLDHKNYMHTKMLFRSNLEKNSGQQYHSISILSKSWHSNARLTHLKHRKLAI